MERSLRFVGLFSRSCYPNGTSLSSFPSSCHSNQITRILTSAPTPISVNNPQTISRRILYAAISITPVLGTLGYYVQKVGWKKIQVSSNGLVRFARSVQTGMRISVDYWWTINITLRGTDDESPEYFQRMHECHERAANRMYEAALKNGGIYVKLGQGLCAFNQLLPQEYEKALRPLEDKALQFFRNDIYELFQEEFQCSPEDMFKEFNPDPVAAASLALVFKAKTKNGKDVAIKAQYIDLQDRFEGDIWCVEILMRLVEWMHPNFGFSWILKEMKGTLSEELDFINEANNSERCKKELEKFNFVTVPAIHWDKTTKRIMTADWYDGCKINDLKGIQEMGLKPGDAAKKLITAFGEQIFSTGFIHGDPHPGNVLVTKSKEDPSKAQLIILDHGLYEKISKKDQQSLCNLWKAIVWKQEDLMKKHAIELGIKEDDFMLFCEILIMRPIRMDRDFDPSDPMTSEEYKYMYDLAAYRFDEIMRCLRGMPKQMILVFRNLNTVRCINHTLGSPADRFSLLAHCAIRGSQKLQYQLSANLSWKRRFQMTMELMQLDIRLNIEWMKIWLLTFYLKVVRFFTRREDLNSIIKELESL